MMMSSRYDSKEKDSDMHIENRHETTPALKRRIVDNGYLSRLSGMPYGYKIRT